MQSGAPPGDEALTFLWQLLLDDLLHLLNIFISGDVQLEDLQITGALRGQAPGPDALWKQAPGEDHEPPLVQAAGQLVSEAAVATRDQHSAATAVLQVATPETGRQLDENVEQHGRDGQEAGELREQEDDVDHDGAAVSEDEDDVLFLSGELYTLLISRFSFRLSCDASIV